MAMGSAAPAAAVAGVPVAALDGGDPPLAFAYAGHAQNPAHPVPPPFRRYAQLFG